MGETLSKLKFDGMELGGFNGYPNPHNHPEKEQRDALKEKMNNYQPIPFEQSKYIILSSSFFLVPAYMFYYHHHYLIGNFATLTSIVSINYWYNVEYDSWRRYSDLVWSKISFCIFFTLAFF